MSNLQSLLFGSVSVQDLVLTVGGCAPAGQYDLVLGKAEYKTDKNGKRFIAFASQLVQGDKTFNYTHNVFQPTVFTVEAKIKGLNIADAESAAGKTIKDVTVSISDKGFNIITLVNKRPTELGEYSAVLQGFAADVESGIGVVMFSINNEMYYDIRQMKTPEEVKAYGNRLTGLAKQLDMIKDAKYMPNEFNNYVGQAIKVYVHSTEKYPAFLSFSAIKLDNITTASNEVEEF